MPAITRPGKRPMMLRARRSSSISSVPRIISLAPAAKAFSACLSARSPPPIWTGTPADWQMRSTARRFSPEPNAPSRSITCSRLAPAATKAWARSTGSPPYSTSVVGSPCFIRTHLPPRKSIAGTTSIGGEVALAADAVAGTLLDRHVRPRRRSVVGGLRPNQTVVGELLENVRRPAGDTPARKQTGKLVAGNAEVGEHRRRVEIHVGVDRIAGLFLLQHFAARLFDRVGRFVPALAFDVTVEGFGHRFEMPRARIAHFVLAMTHAHDALAPFEHLPHVRLGILRSLDFVERPEGRGRRAAVQVALKRRKSSGYRRIHVRTRRG